MPMPISLRAALIGAALGFCAFTARAEVVVVVSAQNPVSAMRASQVEDIFLGKAFKFPDGRPAVPIDAPDGSEVREQFYRTVMGKTLAQLKAYWSKLIFTGKGMPPKEAASMDKLRQAVATHASYIGYLDADKVDSSVKVVEVSK